MEKALVGIIMGSDSDLPVLRETAEILDEFNIAYEMTIVSAHRTPERAFNYAKKAEEKGLEVIICGAGGAAHLAGVIAGISPLPVIGLPIKTSTLSGMDSLLSIVQMPRGIPVAAVAINNAANAGILAAEILGIKFKHIREQVKKYKTGLKEKVIDKAKRLESVGYKNY